MNLKYFCTQCHHEYETEFVFNGFCPNCGHDRMECLNFNEWDKMMKYGKKIQAALDKRREERE